MSWSSSQTQEPPLPKVPQTLESLEDDPGPKLLCSLTVLWSAVLCSIAVKGSGRALQTLGWTEALCIIQCYLPRTISGFQCRRTSHRRHQGWMFDFGLGASSLFFLINDGNILGNFIVLREDMKKTSCFVLSGAVVSSPSIECVRGRSMNLMPFHMDSLGEHVESCPWHAFYH